MVEKNYYRENLRYDRLQTDQIGTLTESQKGVYFECMERPDSTMYNNSYVLRLPPEVDIERFAEAVKTVAESHPVLFANISIENGIPMINPGPVE